MKDVIINVWIRSLFSRHFHRQTKRKKCQWGAVPNDETDDSH
ncbi:hypothetical protein SFC65_08850 [Priestia filamentosa]|nr:hypothetical protein [Priestia filamentosa]